MAVNSTNHRLNRILVAFVTAALLGCLAPSAAWALSVTQSSTRPNGSSGQSTYGSIPTRFTWQVQLVAGDPALNSVQIKLPAGTNLKDSTVKVVTVQGLNQVPVATAPKISGETIEVPFTPPVQNSTPGVAENVRVTVENVVFPAKGGTYQVESTAQTDSGQKTIPTQAGPIIILPMSLTERMIYRLNQAKWVAAWNSVNFLQMFFNPQIIVASISVEFKGWLLSLLLVLIGFPLAIPIGLLLAFAKMAKFAVVRWIASFYVNVIRGTPLFLQIYIAFFGLPLLGINPNKYLLGILVLALNSSAYLAEIFRAGIQSISKGQFEAASSLGMNYWQSMQYVIIPQTVKRVLPTMTSEFILLYKDTALLSAVGVFELMLYSKNLSAISGNVTPYVVAAGYYLVVTTPLIRYVRSLEERLAIAEGGAAASETKPKKKKTDKSGEPAVAGPVSGMLASSTEHESR
jgi:polar amino acid transport system substrate-binding protein